MNRYNLITENIFRSEENILWLKKMLMKRFGIDKKGGNKKVKLMAYNFINENIERLVGDYNLRHLMDYSSPINYIGVEPDIHRQVRCLNAQFLQDRYEFITASILDLQSGTHGDWQDRKIYGTVGVSDVYPASGRTQYFGFGSSEGSNKAGIIATDLNKQRTPLGVVKPSLDPVASWDRVTQPIQMRDDSAGKDGAEVGAAAGPHYSTPLQTSNFAYTYQYNDNNDGIADDGSSDLRINHVDTRTSNDVAAASWHMKALVGNNYYKSLNAEKLWNGPDGGSSFDPNDYGSGGAQYEKLLYDMSQGSVRSSDVSKRDTPKYWERSLYGRSYQRDVDEALSGSEYGNLSETGKPMNRGYDMSSLLCRVESKGNTCTDDKRPQQNRHRAFGPEDPYKNQTSYMADIDLN
jgi:hypothetical protein